MGDLPVVHAVVAVVEADGVDEAVECGSGVRSINARHGGAGEGGGEDFRVPHFVDRDGNVASVALGANLVVDVPTEIVI